MKLRIIILNLYEIQKKDNKRIEVDFISLVKIV